MRSNWRRRYRWPPAPDAFTASFGLTVIAMTFLPACCSAFQLPFDCRYEPSALAYCVCNSCAVFSSRIGIELVRNRFAGVARAFDCLVDDLAVNFMPDVAINRDAPTSGIKCASTQQIEPIASRSHICANQYCLQHQVSRFMIEVPRYSNIYDSAVQLISWLNSLRIARNHTAFWPRRTTDIRW